MSLSVYVEVCPWIYLCAVCQDNTATILRDCSEISAISSLNTFYPTILSLSLSLSLSLLYLSFPFSSLILFLSLFLFSLSRSLLLSLSLSLSLSRCLCLIQSFFTLTPLTRLSLCSPSFSFSLAFIFFIEFHLSAL